ncbi:hypothetical protein IWW40_001274 [Coemansia sp. RSA 1250]|nr:hypothetical protein IWW40_001274 [Coemansia sp. RSA 1250]
MDSRVEQPAFDEMPFVFQARIRDIEQELEEGEITQKGFDKRLAKIMQEYQAAQADRSPELASQSQSLEPSTTSPDTTTAVETVDEPTPIPRVRNGSKKAFYDARKSTVAGFKKPGINFEALLEDFDADDDSELLRPVSKYGGKTLANSPSSSSPSQQSSQFQFNLGSPLQPAPPPMPELPQAARAPAARDDERFDMELSSGRAYNVLSDMMDPYGAPSSRSVEQLYSDDSNSILDDIGEPSEFNPDIITQEAASRPYAATNGDAEAIADDAVSVTSSVEVKRMNSLMYPRRQHPMPDTATMPKMNDLRRHISRQNHKREFPLPRPESNSSLEEEHVSSPEPLLSANESSVQVTNEAAVASVSAAPSKKAIAANMAQETASSLKVAEPPNLATAAAAKPSMLTPDTPSTHLFVTNAHSDISAAQEPHAKLPAASDNGLSPISVSASSSSVPRISVDASSQIPEQRLSSSAVTGVGGSNRSRNGTISLADAAENSAMMLEILAARGNRDSLKVTENEFRASIAASSNRGSYSHWLEYTAAMEAHTQAEQTQAEQTQLQQTLPAGEFSIESTAKDHTDSDRLASELEETLGFSESMSAYSQLPATEMPAHEPLISSAFGTTIAGLATDLPTVTTSTEPREDFSMQERTPPRPVRRPTYGPRTDRRPTNSMAVAGMGRASYYAAEVELEIPVNFDLEIPDVASPTVPATAMIGEEQQQVPVPEEFSFAQQNEQAYPTEQAYSGENNEQQGSDGWAAYLPERELPVDAYSSKLKAILEEHNSLASILRYRASATAGEIAYTCVDGKGRESGSWTWAGLHARAIQTAQLLRQRGVTVWGERVALVYRKYEMLEFVGSLFGCFYAGMCAVPVVAGDSYAELVHVLGSTGAALVLTTELNIRALNKDLAQNNVGPGWPSVPWVRTDALGGYVLSATGAQNAAPQFQARPVADVTYNSSMDVHIDALKPTDCAYIEFSKSPNGELKGVQMTHGAVMRQCATWMASTGMLDMGRKYKHRVELDADEPALDYSLGLEPEPSVAESAGGDSSPSTQRSALEPPTLHSPVASNSSSPAVESERRSGRGSLGKKIASSGFLGRLRNVGSLPRLRRSSRSRESTGVSSARNSMVGSVIGSGRVRAASNLSTVMAPEPLVPRIAVAAPSANVGVFRDVVVFYVEPRQHLGLAYGVLGGCFGGHQSVYASSALCDAPGAYVHVLTQYRATVAVGDYAGLQSVLASATDDPREIWEFSRKATPNLARLRLCLVDTLFIDPIFHAAFDKNVLHPFGCPYQSIASTEGHPVVTPVCTLAEHGSALLAIRDCLTPLDTSCEFVLDRAAFRANRILVLPDEQDEAAVDRVGTVRYQSFGRPALGAAVAVVDPETRELCAADAIGELWLASAAVGSGFWGLPKLSRSIFAARFAGGSGAFLRTGLMGAVVRGQVLVFGFYEDRIRTLTAEAAPAWLTEPALGFHYAGDLDATLRRLLPQVTESAAFEVFANGTHFPVVAAEVRDNSGRLATVAEEIYSVLRTRHSLHAFAIALCRPDTLPRAFQYGKRVVNAQLCRHQFESGRVDCLFVRMSTDRLFLNLPPPAAALPVDDIADLDPSVALYGRWQQQTSLEPAGPIVDGPTRTDLSSFSSITDLLVWRASTTPDKVAYAPFDDRGRAQKPLTYQGLAARVAAVAHLLVDKRRVSAGAHVLVAIPPSVAFVTAMHACLAIGAIPIPVALPDLERLSDDLPPLLAAAREFSITHIIVDAAGEDVFGSKLMAAALRVPSLLAILGGRRMPAIASMAKASKSARHVLGKGALRFNLQWADRNRPALVMQFTGPQPSTPQFVAYSHRALMSFCAQQKSDFQMIPSLPLIASVRAYNGYGLLHCCAIGVYVGCPTLLLPPSAFFAAPNVWFELVQHHRVKDAFTTLPMLQHAINFFTAHAGRFSFDLSAVRNLIVATEERVDPAMYAAVRDFMVPQRLDPSSINPLYGTLMNPCISTRAYLGVAPLDLRLDIHALRRNRVVALPPPTDAEDAANGLTLLDSGKVSGSTMVAIVDPASRQSLPAGCIGEVWVCSDSNALHKQTPAPASVATRPSEVSTVFLDGDSEHAFVRTGDLGFLYLQVTDAPAPAEPYLFVAGKVSETFNVDGYLYFYADIERAVAEPSDDLGIAGCVVIQTTVQASPDAPADAPPPPAENAPLRLVAVISLRAAPSRLCLPNAACLIFNNVLDRHQVLLDEIVFVPRDTLPRSRIAERRRRTVRGMYESGKLNPFVTFPISSSPTLEAGINPNNRQSFLGPPAFGPLN